MLILYYMQNNAIAKSATAFGQSVVMGAKTGRRVEAL